MRKIRRALAAAALMGAALSAGPALSAGAQSSEDEARSGYWLVGADGGIFTYGHNAFYGSMGSEELNEPVVGMAATATGAGYWEVALDGGIFSFGDAEFHGSMGGEYLNDPVVGMAPTPHGEGYWLVASDGGIFAFGDAEFHGSMGGRHLNEPVVGIVPTWTGRGYYLVASDGGVFAFGDADFAGSLGGNPPPEPIVGLASSGDGYVTVTASGRIDEFGAPAVPSLDPAVLRSPIMAVENDENTEGFWLVAADGTVYELAGAQWWGDARHLPLNAPMMAMASVARFRPEVVDSTPPTVTVAPVEAGSTTVVFTANEPLWPGSVDDTDFSTTGTGEITDVWLSEDWMTITVTVDAPLADGDTVTLHAETLEDAPGNTGPADDVVVTVRDTTAPVVTAGTVEAGSTTVTFTSEEPLLAGSVDETDFTTTGSGAITDATLSADGRTVTVTVAAPLEEGDVVTLTAGSVEDEAGNAGPAAAVTVVVPVITVPVVTVGAVEAGSTTVTFTSDTPLLAGSVDATDFTTTGSGAVTSATLSADGRTVTVTVAAPLEDGDVVTLTAGAVEDEAGNAGPAAAVAVVVADTTGPTITSASGIDDGDGRVNAGDQWTLVFSERMDEATTESANFLVEDPDGTAGTFTCHNVACVLDIAGTTLQVNLTGEPAVGPDAGVTPNFQYPLTITGTGTTAPEDVNGNPLDVPGSSDSEVNVVVAPAPSLTAVAGAGVLSLGIDVGQLSGFGAGDSVAVSRHPSENDGGTPTDCTDDFYAAAGTAVVGSPFDLLDDQSNTGASDSVIDVTVGAPTGCQMVRAIATIDGAVQPTLVAVASAPVT